MMSKSLINLSALFVYFQNTDGNVAIKQMKNTT